MSARLTPEMVSKIAKLNLTGLSHCQRLDAIAGVLGYANQASMMASLRVPKPRSGSLEEIYPTLAAVQNPYPVWWSRMFKTIGEYLSSREEQAVFATQIHREMANRPDLEDAQKHFFLKILETGRNPLMPVLRAGCPDNTRGYLKLFETLTEAYRGIPGQPRHAMWSTPWMALQEQNRALATRDPRGARDPRRCVREHIPLACLYVGMDLTWKGGTPWNFLPFLHGWLAYAIEIRKPQHQEMLDALQANPGLNNPFLETRARAHHAAWKTMMDDLVDSLRAANRSGTTPPPDMSLFPVDITPLLEKAKADEERWAKDA